MSCHSAILEDVSLMVDKLVVGGSLLELPKNALIRYLIKNDWAFSGGLHKHFAI